MAALTETEIILIIFELYEGDNTGWTSTSSEYISARAFCNAAIRKWERYDNTVWRDLFTTLTANTQSSPALVKTLTAGTYTYTCPTDFLRPCSWVRTVSSGGTVTFWEVIPPEKVAKLDENSGYFCYFTGSVKDGFVLNFNSELTLTTGDTITYEYYKQATLLTATTSTTEVSDPYFIVYYVLARILKNDGEDYTEEEAQWKELLENMKTANMSGYFDVPNTVEDPLSGLAGFGQ